MLASCDLKPEKECMKFLCCVCCVLTCSIILWLKCGPTCEIIHNKNFNTYNDQMSVAQSYITFGGQTCDKEAAIQQTFHLDKVYKKLVLS